MRPLVEQGASTGVVGQDMVMSRWELLREGWMGSGEVLTICQQGLALDSGYYYGLWLSRGFLQGVVGQAMVLMGGGVWGNLGGS